MMIPLWVSVVVAVIAGIFGGIVAPLVTAVLARRNWQAQRTLELKHEVFRGATGALAWWLTDALDTRLQSSKAEYKGMTRQVEMRPETSQALEQYRGLVAAFFSEDVAHKFDEAVRVQVSLDNIPNMRFEEKRLAFVEAASRELGLLSTRKPGAGAGDESAAA